MESLDRNLTLEIPHNMNLDSLVGNFFTTATYTNKKTAFQLLNDTSQATITSIDLKHQQLQLQHHQQQRSTSTIGSQFLQKIGETLFGYGGKSFAPIGHRIGVSGKDISLNSNMDLLRNHIVIDSADFNAVASSATSDLQQQMEYDKFMNEIWIGIVLTLIIISMVFCICSCFLYHQFRQWKRNYRHNLQQSQDIESVKLNPDADDPVPEYTLVSGLPSYEAALELMQNKAKALLPRGSDSSSCLIVYPSLYNVFTMSEKDSCVKSFTLAQSATTVAVASAAGAITTPQSPSIVGAVTSTTVPTMPTTATATTTTTTTTTTPIVSQNVKCQNVPRLALHSIPSYDEATSRQPQQYQPNDTSICLMKSPSWCGDTTKVLLVEEKN